MTQDEIIEMADKADEEADKVLNTEGEYHPNWHQVRNEIFAKLVAQHEREACAKVCDEMHKKEGFYEIGQASECAEAIRARGQA